MHHSRAVTSKSILPATIIRAVEDTLTWWYKLREINDAVSYLWIPHGGVSYDRIESRDGRNSNLTLPRSFTAELNITKWNWSLINWNGTKRGTRKHKSTWSARFSYKTGCTRIPQYRIGNNISDRNLSRIIYNPASRCNKGGSNFSTGI